ncbi:UNVERIFIED_CONTAM: hypothetical protein O8I53_10445 [Campylobacter lari]
MFEGNIVKNNDSIVGAKYSKTSPLKHIITHCININFIKETINDLSDVIKIIEKNFGESISNLDLENINTNNPDYNFNKKINSSISKTKFVNLVVDSYYVEKIGIEEDVADINENALISIYKTGTETAEIFKQLNIDYFPNRTLDDTTVLLTPDQYKILKLKAPYLIAMSVSDIAQFELENYKVANNDMVMIPEPKNEPTIGVIDTMFDKEVYFKD